MNTDFTVIGWIHTLASLIALLIGARILLRMKGDATHRRDGLVYLWAMVATNVTALLIYNQGTFRVFHAMAIGTLLLVLFGYQSAKFLRRAKPWLYAHISSMVVSYYMLIGGTINETFLHVNSLRQLAPDLRGPMLGISHSAAMLVFAAILVYLLLAGRKRYARPRS